MSRQELLLQHPAIQELFSTFKLHDDFTQKKIIGWVERWLSVGAIQATFDDVPPKEDQQKLLDGMFGELSQKFVQQKAAASAVPHGKGVIFHLQVLCVNREPVLPKKTIGPTGLVLGVKSGRLSK